MKLPQSVFQGASAAVLPFSQIQDGFRQLQAGSSTTVLLEPHPEDVLPIVPRKAAACVFDPQASYVISGGLGGLGMSIARWMASRGAKNLILLSRRGPVTDTAKAFISELEQQCDRIVAPATDVSDLEALTATISECLASMPPIKGCIQGSMVLKVSNEP